MEGRDEAFQWHLMCATHGRDIKNYLEDKRPKVFTNCEDNVLFRSYLPSESYNREMIMINDYCHFTCWSHDNEVVLYTTVVAGVSDLSGLFFFSIHLGSRWSCTRSPCSTSSLLCYTAVAGHASLSLFSVNKQRRRREDLSFYQSLCKKDFCFQIPM